MNLTFTKKELIEQFLDPISRIAEDCSLKLNSKEITSLVTDSNGTIILNAQLAVSNPDITNELVLNIKDIKKFIRVLECINADVFNITVDNNLSVLQYTSADISFKLNLVLDSAIKKCTLSLNKIEALKFNTEFNLSTTKLSDILKGSSFASESNKIYFYTKDSIVYSELTDKATNQLDSITFKIADSYVGSNISTPLPFSVDILRLFTTLKNSLINVKVNTTYRIILFELKNEKGFLKYIIPAYVK